MEQLVACKTEDGRFAVRPISWAGIWGKNGMLANECNSLAYFEEEQDANDYIAYRALGTVEELSALVKARDEGRVVALPCKVGDTVYWMWTDSEGNCEAPIHTDRIYEIRITKDGVELSIKPYDGSIGKVGIHPPLGVFLNRAEAEAALSGGVQT